MSKAILLSGGMDSVSLSYWKRPDHPFTLNYGQMPSTAEINAASTVADILNIEHHVINVDLSDLGSGDMANRPPLPEAPVPEWWPYRNQMLITIAAMKAISLGVTEIMMATLKTDAQHSDGTPEFIQKMSDIMQHQEGNIKVTSPAIQLDAIELVQCSGIPPEILCWSHSCHTSNLACGVCRGCLKHHKTMSIALGIPY